MENQNYLVYQYTTETIRQMPQNYLIAHKKGRAWVCEPDLASDKELATRVFLALFEFNNKYSDGLGLLASVTPNKMFHSPTEQVYRPKGFGVHFLQVPELMEEFTSMTKDEFLKANPQISDLDYENTFGEGNYVFNSMRVPKLRKGALK